MNQARKRQREVRGLSGTNGEQPDGSFVNRPYGAADDEVFVVADSDRGWRRQLLRMALSSGETIIMCAACRERPAKTLDHQFPWGSDGNRCEECGS